jgi:hypothetical protein
MRLADCAGALQYVCELTWNFFLGVLDECERWGAEEAEAMSADIRHRWHPATAGEFELFHITDWS